MRFTLYLFFLITSLSLALVSRAEDNPLRKIIINKGDSTIHISICPTTEEIKCNSKVMYFWYQDGKMHVNRGAHSGNLVHGEVRTYNAKGDLVEKGQMKLGVKKGKWIKWHSGGEVKQITHWRRGMKSGKEFHYNSQRELILKRKFKKDRDLEKDVVFNDGKIVKPEKIKKIKREKGVKKLKTEKFPLEDNKGDKKRDRENREKYRWFKNLFNRSDQGDKMS